MTLVAVTGYGEQVHGGRLEEVGFDKLLVKPVRRRSCRSCWGAAGLSVSLALIEVVVVEGSLVAGRRSPAGPGSAAAGARLAF